ncbi:hypothetical protein LQ938_03785 [Microbacterium sp. cx-55]|uniref:hypothetical protein n=1 Tax=Microbacterium sp. cx-55 TaxID=2875948 RepID=UPI001CBA6D53|nr:hypothetical protein [Microbacterium sp. cx-55]MBZ4487012.1 hypothetical protein [Microbacterium sp. cx-55]UGB35931.1 hypothetical protein LQ938_03785 [Microbacterium sp. cx-55]
MMNSFPKHQFTDTAIIAALVPFVVVIFIGLSTNQWLITLIGALVLLAAAVFLIAGRPPRKKQ